MSDPSIPGATPPSYPPAPPTAPPVNAPVFAAPPGGPPPELAPVTSGGSGGGRKVLLLVVALVVLGVGAFASMQLLGGDDRGAGSPEEAAEQLVDALNQSDVLGVVDLLPTGERDVLLEVADLGDEFRRLGVLDDAFTLDGFGGVDLQISDPEFDVAELSDSDAGSLSLVSLTGGTVSIDVDGDELAGNVGEVVEALVDEAGGDVETDDFSDEIDVADVLDELQDEAEDDDVEFVNPFSVAVIGEDGRFFPSIGFTTAELARLAANADGADIDAPDLDDGIEPDGADSPEEAVQALFDAATSADAEAALAVMDPGELGAAQVYVPLFADLGGSSDTGVEVDITEVRTESTGRGGTRVVPTEFTVQGDLDDLEFEFTLEDECLEFNAEADGDEFELDRTCFDEDIESDIADDVDIPEEISDLVAAFLPIEGGIVTVERDGEHFVSPIRTTVQSIEGVVDDLDRADVEEGGIVFEAAHGELGDEFEELADELDDAFEDADPDEAVVAVLALAQDLEIDIVESLVSAPGVFGVGSFVVGVAVLSSLDESFEEGFEEGFEIDEPIIDEPFDPSVERVPTGASGPNGELLLGDVVSGFVPEDGVATFTAIVSSEAALVGAQAQDGSDLTVTVLDALTGEELAFDDDFNRPDPEALVQGLAEGQLLTIEVREFDGDAGDFVVYFEQF